MLLNFCFAMCIIKQKRWGDIMKISENCYKPENTANPISPNVLCADPTGVEYNGRLYIYGTNDHQ